MSNVKIRRSLGSTMADVVSPEHGVDIRGVGPGDTIEVPAGLAGQPGYWRPLKPGEREMPYLQLRTHDDVREVWDLGSGLLAQAGNWEPVTPVKRPRAQAKAEAQVENPATED